MFRNTISMICASALLLAGCAGQAGPASTDWLARSQANCARGVQYGEASCHTIAAAQYAVREEAQADADQKTQAVGAILGSILLVGLAAAASGPGPGPGPGFHHGPPPPLPPPPPPR